MSGLIGFLGAALVLTTTLLVADRLPRTGLTPRTIWLGALAALPVWLIAVAIICFGYPDRYAQWAIESGPTEWFSFWSASFASAFFLATFVGSVRNAPNLLALGLFVLTFLYAGEEVSWGQFVFGVEPPQFFQENNTQNETTLHNLRLGGIYLGSYLQAFAPLVLAVGFIVGQHLMPGFARRHVGFDFDAAASSAVIAFLLVVCLSAFPFGQDSDSPVPLDQVFVKLFSAHSFFFSEIVESTLAGLLLIGSIALSRWTSGATAGATAPQLAAVTH